MVEMNLRVPNPDLENMSFICMDCGWELAYVLPASEALCTRQTILLCITSLGLLLLCHKNELLLKVVLLPYCFVLGDVPMW